VKGLDATFRSIRTAGKKALSVYLTAGYPTRSMTVQLAVGLASAGADLIEIGIPFSDPIADGPVIQECSTLALSAGTTPEDVLSMVKEIRNSTPIPIILMGYVNPILAYGMGTFIQDAKLSGADGTIIPDLYMEESGAYLRNAAESGMAPVFMVTPTTPESRLGEIDRISRGFVYAVTVNGVTGERTGTGDVAGESIARMKQHVTRNPLLAGFGISDPETASGISRLCDGVIIGSAVMNRLRHEDPETGYRSALGFISSVRTALDG